MSNYFDSILKELLACSSDKEERNSLLKYLREMKNKGIITDATFHKAYNFWSVGAYVDSCLLTLPQGSELDMSVTCPGDIYPASCTISHHGGSGGKPFRGYSLSVSIAVCVLMSGVIFKDGNSRIIIG